MLPISTRSRSSPPINNDTLTLASLLWKLQSQRKQARSIVLWENLISSYDSIDLNLAAPYRINEYQRPTFGSNLEHRLSSQQGIDTLGSLGGNLLQHMAHQRPPHMSGGGGGHLYGGTHTSGKAKARTHDEFELALSSLGDGEDDLEIDPRHHHPHQQTHQHPQHHHHHHVPDEPPPSKIARTSTGPGGNISVGMGGSGPSTIPGLSSQSMPPPAARPRGPKLKFTTEDDQLLVDLKENKALTWKQIAEFFPGRSSGTLQVRYCTKLKAKTTQWTDDTVSFSYSYSCIFFPL